MRQLPILILPLLAWPACGGAAAPADDPAPATGDAVAELNASIAALEAREESEVAETQVQHILIAFQGTGTEATRSKAEAQELAAEVFKAAIVDGADFGELVKKYTDDSPPGIYSMVTDRTKQDFSKSIYWRNGMVPAFGNVGWRLRVGEIGVAPHDATKSKFGWHIIKRLK